MQQVSSITRKRLSARAFERLEKAQAGLEELKQHLATLEASGKKLQTDLDANTEEQERQQASLTKCRHQNSMLHDRIQDLEAVIQEHEQASEDAARKVLSLVVASQGVDLVSTCDTNFKGLCDACRCASQDTGACHPQSEPLSLRQNGSIFPVFGSLRLLAYFSGN